jgi:hypothetical protein
VRSLKEFETAELHERNVAPREFDFEAGAMMRGAEQDSLRLQRDARLAIFENSLDDIARLCRVIRYVNQVGTLRRGAVRPQVFCEPFGCKIDDGIGCCKNRLCRAVVPLQRDDFGLWAEVSGKSRMLRTVAARKE